MASNEEPILEEAMAGLRDATQRIRAGENGMLAGGMPISQLPEPVYACERRPGDDGGSLLGEARRRRGCKKDVRGRGLTLGGSR
jgi:hypothetical protein